jgi:hypothetical protein
MLALVVVVVKGGVTFVNQKVLTPFVTEGVEPALCIYAD